MSTLAERLKIAIDAAGISQADLHRLSGVTQGAVSQWLSGEVKTLRAENALKVARCLGVSPDWLATGLGPMRPTSPVPIEPGEEFVPVARVRLKLQAGITGFAVEHVEGNGPPIFFRRDFLAAKGWKPERLLALKVMGDSMEPALFDGDLVVVNTAETEPKDGEVFAVNYEGEAVIKRLRRDTGQWWLDSDNPRYKPKRCDDHAILIGRVVYRQTERI